MIVTRRPKSFQLWSGTTFHSITDGIESALDQARRAAGGKDVSLAGAAPTVQEYFKAGLIAEMIAMPNVTHLMFVRQ